MEEKICCSINVLYLDKELQLQHGIVAVWVKE